MSACIGEPLSWLLLERQALGELGADEARRVLDHLAACAACREVSDAIAKDAPLLTALPAVVRPIHARKLAWGRRATAATSVIALAAAVLLLVGRRPESATRTSAATSDRVKGSEVGFALVRDDDARIEDGGGIYRDGDRFKALVTCPPGMRASFDLVVYERGEASFPLEPATTLACGNAVPMPGAFRVTGRELLTVCLVWNEDAVDRNMLRVAGHGLSERNKRCLALDSAP